MMKTLPIPVCLALLSITCWAVEKSSHSGSVTIALDGPVQTFLPSKAFGGGIDGHESGEVKMMLSPQNVKQMLSAGLKPLSYRLRTELAIEAWHWNPHGTWSDPARKQGYWTSDAHSDGPIELSYGYRLPRRGHTLDEANNDGYSRMADGDPATFWKSNPYLDAHFTSENNAQHPQWVAIDLGRPRKINALRIHWGTPFATRFTVEYARADDTESPEGTMFYCANPPGLWRAFPHGEVADSAGGDALLRLADRPITARHLRVRMSASSGTGPDGSADIRDRLGYAIREIEAGVLDAQGQFQDFIVHREDKKQSEILVSSTDPWHRETDCDEMIEQPGFDLVFRSGLTQGLPMLVPVPILYDTPENAAAEIAFLASRGYPLSRIEMGEEPDGQRIDPADYGALYVQVADAIHRIEPDLQLGGPSFLTLPWERESVEYTYGNGWWLKRFLHYLASRQHSDDFNFFSFEWYPFDEVGKPSASLIAQAPRMLRAGLARMHQSGLAKPMTISEYGYSPFGNQAEVEIAGALINADIVGLFLTLGGETAYLYGYEPNCLINERGSWGNNMLFLEDDHGSIIAPMAAYYGTQLLTQEWAQPSDGPHETRPASSDVKNARGDELVTAYAVHRPDQRWAVMLINKDPARSCRLRLQFRWKKAVSPFRGPCDVYQFSSQQYAWHEAGEHGAPSKSLPPSHEVVPDPNAGFLLPPYSLTVVRGSPDSAISENHQR